MSQFMITYIGGNRPSSEDEGREHMAKYMAWISSLGDSAVSPMNPLRNTQTVSPGGSVTDGGKSSMSGYTIVEAGSHDDAVAMAKECPFLDIGGSLEVSELIKMPG